jgi:putative flippase GtrA
MQKGERSTARQFARYAVVGFASNALLYLGYLGLAAQRVGPKLAMTFMYVIGVALTFAFNKHWTFGNHSKGSHVFFRYCLVYGAGYALNFVALLGLVDRLHFPHEVVQGLLILVVAAILFLLQKFWVFGPDSST